MPNDLELFRQSRRVLRSLFDALEFEYVDDHAWPEPSDTSYLTEEDRANPDIAANVEAMAATNGMIAWIGRDSEGFIGLWRGPEATPVDLSCVVRLDTEGQYRIVSRTLADYLLISGDHSEFHSHRRTLIALGFRASESVDQIWSSVESVAQEPNEFRNKLYYAGRAQRGLP